MDSRHAALRIVHGTSLVGLHRACSWSPARGSFTVIPRDNRASSHSSDTAHNSPISLFIRGMCLPDSVDVLVVGAGPTGLCLALALQIQGCTNVAVVDSMAEGENGSRAVAIHAATLEALEQIGVIHPILQATRKIRAPFLRTKSLTIEMGTFDSLSEYTNYPFMSSIPQHITDRILQDAARERGIQIYRPHRVTSVAPNEEHPSLTDVTFEDGHVLRARCIVGADGSHSLVRHNAQIGWADPDGDPDAAETNVFWQMVMGDVILANAPAWPINVVNLIGSDDNDFLFIALPDHSYAHLPAEDPIFRIVCGIPTALGTPPHAPDTAYLQQIVDAWGPNAILPPGSPRVTIKQTAWSSRFRTRYSLADTMFTYLPTGFEGDAVQRHGGPVLLIGDAAHIHPPMGGQGMNLGIRDAVRLAPVLATYVRTRASDDWAPGSIDIDAPLRRWAEERRERAITVIHMVKRMSRMMSLANRTTWILGVVPVNLVWLRNTFLRIVCSFAWWRTNVAYRVSGLGNP
ncbi:FAD/NAD(P)-binding domain-containing protein [Trametes elegans]|nr:FAD/NAD(P)-binding domain-containing protein [Trametes elegans]